MGKARKTILATGGAGFIGSHLCQFFVEKGHRVICVDNLLTGNLNNISDLKNKSNFRFIKHDITKPLKIEKQIDFILHFASPASPAKYLKFPIETLKVGSLGTQNALELAKEKKAKFLLASSSEVYGDPLVHPQNESYFGNVNPVGPRSAYDEAKRYAEALTITYHRVYKIDVKITRPFNIYGPRLDPRDGRAISSFITRALAQKPLTINGNGKQSRSFCYISDFIDGVDKLMHSTVNEPINLGNPQEITILQLAESIITLTKSKSKITFKPALQDDPACRQPDIDKAQKLLGWQPQINLEEGLKQTIAWFKQRNKR